MSSRDGLAAIIREFEEAKATARVYLTDVGVLAWEGISMREYRKREEGIMRDAILNDGAEPHYLPRDRFAADAAFRAWKYLSLGRDPKILNVLRERASCHPAYGKALTIVARKLQEMGADMPDWLRVWEPPSSRENEKRWRRERTRRYLIGMVIEALATGSNILFQGRENDREGQQLQYDLRALDDLAAEEMKGNHPPKTAGYPRLSLAAR